GDTITVSGSITAITDGLLGNVCVDTGTISGTFEGIDTVCPYVLSCLPQDKENGVSPDVVIQISFNERMNEEKTKGAFSIKGIRDKDGQEIDELISGVVSYDTDNFKLFFTPDSGLKKNFTYQVTITSEATDTIGNSLPEERFTFTTIIDYTKNNTVLSWGEETRLSVLPSGLSVDFFFVIDPGSQCTELSNILQANDKFKLDDDPFNSILEDTITRINTFNSARGILKDNFNLPITVTLSYNDVAPADGIVDGTMPPVREGTLQMYRLDENSNLWVRLANSVVDSQANTVSASSIHTSVFALAGSSYSDLFYAYAFPVPFKPSRGDSEIIFVNLSPMATIRIFTLNGELVKKIEHTSGDTILSWDVTNDHGEKLASGVYLYLIKNEKQSKKGKLMIVK
ncbi:Ig-like domain-containing protein, partial [bacterium]|nr:Ig-like domain-containing protein [bacterium]